VGWIIILIAFIPVYTYKSKEFLGVVAIGADKSALPRLLGW